MKRSSLIAFTLSMPNVASWNGKWSGEGKYYAIIRSVPTATIDAYGLKDGYFHYSWPDGWAAGITTREIESRTAAKLRRKSVGFCDYDWMVDSILARGQIKASHELEPKP